MKTKHQLGTVTQKWTMAASLVLAWVFASPLLAVNTYTNSLKDQSSVASDFTDYTQGNGNFRANSTHGLTLATTQPNWAVGIKVWNQFLPASMSWQVTIKAHLSAFLNTQESPYYNAGITLAKFGGDFFSSYPNRLNLQLNRLSALDSGTSMTNVINEGIYSNDSGDTLPIVDLGSTEDVFLRYKYSAQNFTVSLFYSMDGVNFLFLKSYNLAQAWGVNSQDSIALALACANDPYDDHLVLGGFRPTDHDIFPGQIALSDLEIGPDPDLDMDANGLPDAWEIANFGSMGVDLSADADGDGTSNFMEFLAGTNPNSSASVFRLAPRVEGGQLRLTIPTIAGRHYRIWGTDALASEWTPQTVFSGTGSPYEWQYALTGSSTGRYFLKCEISLSRFDVSQNMITVQGGTLPQSSGLAGTQVQSFKIGKYEVTWEEWLIVRDWAVKNGYDLDGVGGGSNADHPVRDVSWYDAVKWCNARSEMEGLTPVYQFAGATYRTGEIAPTVNGLANGYRLPTEAEWEWAARGGVKSVGYIYSGSNYVIEVAWHFYNSTGALVILGNNRGTWPVGQKLANELGIHDMSGNLWEWCWDVVNTSDRRSRGGSWTDGGSVCEVAYRESYDAPEERYNLLGFRLARNSGK